MITETAENVIPNERALRHIVAMRQTLSRFAPDTFTLLLVATVALASFAPPTAALETPVKIATDVAIAFMFFLYGARLATANVIAGVAHWRLHALVLASTFVLFPLVGLALFHALPQWLVPGPLALGMLYLCLLPSTIQSSLAFTSIAGGNVPAAMCSATLSSLIGALATPLLVAMFASARGGAPTADAIREIALLLVAPLVAGQLLRPWIGGFVLRQKAILSATDRGSILLVVYGAFGHAVSAGLWHALPISGFAIMIVIEALGSGVHALRHLCRREGFRLQSRGHDRYRLLRIEEKPCRRSAHGGRAVPRPAARHDPPADHALPPDAAHGLRRAGAALGAGREARDSSAARSRAASWRGGGGKVKGRRSGHIRPGAANFPGGGPRRARTPIHCP